MEDYEYEIDCEVCQFKTRIITFGTDQSPEVCPMCGADQQSIPLGDYETY